VRDNNVIPCEQRATNNQPIPGAARVRHLPPFLGNSHEATSASVWINPLRLFADEANEKPNDIIRSLSFDRSEGYLDRLHRRDNRLSEFDNALEYVPADKTILNKIVWPLRSSKLTFCLGDFFASITLSGVTCEMAVIFIYDLMVATQDQRIRYNSQKGIFRDRYYEDHMHQMHRIDRLLELNVVDREFAHKAHGVRNLRNDYVHNFDRDFSDIEENAYMSYRWSYEITKALVGFDKDFALRGIAVPEHLDEYLAERGVVQE